MLRATRALLATRNPLDAELGVSEMLGSWWGRRMPGMDIEHRLAEGLIARAAGAGTPAGLALLAGIRVLGISERHRELAETGVQELTSRDVRRPAWADSLGRVQPVAAYVSGSGFADTDDIICVFRYTDGERDDEAERPAAADTAGSGHGDRGAAAPAGGATEHALIAVVDHNSGGILRDAWVTTKVDRLLAHCRSAAEGGDPMATFTPLRPDRARRLLEDALRRTDLALEGAGERPSAAGPDSPGLIGASLAAHHALLRARVRALPRRPESARAPLRPVWRRDRRATLAARFLASDAAAELSDSYAASRCVDHIIAYGCDVDGGRPMRVSPRKVEAFLLTWLPRRLILLPEEQEAMPHVLAAWIRWAGPRTGLPEVAVGATLDALWEATSAFTTSYLDLAASFGLRQEVIRRLLPDGDLSALPRRMFAFPLLTSDLLEESAAEFDPGTPEGRRALLRLDHFGEYDAPVTHRGKHSAQGAPGPAPDARADGPGAEEELAAHERLAERLWRGDPPALWSAAERLLDRGHSRPEVLRILLDTVAAAEAGGDEPEKRLEGL
ncbi:hypothetical protein ACFO4E_04825 [Nocardiopsis mangrovi]|uniref:Uncharacterized protein n=1 Tax=Nocardiopsis mangrovi TaxID=1179818 RepID=A0ABV9DU90_9ACTN